MKMTKDEFMQELAMEVIEINTEREKYRNEFIKENQKQWIENDQKLKARRDKHSLSLRDVAHRLKTSPTRIRNLELGNPISMAEGLTASYNLLFDYIELRNSFRILYEEHNLNWRL